jgi:hypothetical protein
VTERPILFSAPMVRALLDGHKTQTRRILKAVPPKPEASCHPRHQQKQPEPYLDSYCSNYARRDASNPRGMSQDWCWWQVDDRQCLPTFKVAYVPGDLLWIRETWQTHCDMDHITPRDLPADTAVQYPATYDHWVSRNRPGIHMPRWASRISLLVTGVRIERLQDISEEDAKAEGVSWDDGEQEEYVRKWGYPQTAKARFADLWESINGPGSWDANPWVVAVTFERINEKRAAA